MCPPSSHLTENAMITLELTPDQVQQLLLLLVNVEENDNTYVGTFDDPRELFLETADHRRIADLASQLNQQTNEQSLINRLAEVIKENTW